jgi:peptidoglycan/xylan/chitin deacetylase (PgdA/CDA1 family)
VLKAILTWHSVDDSGSVISVSPSQLERHLDWLASGRVRVVPLCSLLSGADADDTVALTFDDGFANFSTVAAPLFLERGLPATVFIVPSRVGGTNAWDTNDGVGGIPSLHLMSWDDIRAVEHDGFEIGGHGLTHASLAGQDASSLAMEVEECTSIIEASTGKRPSSFAYPYGKYDAATIAAVSKTYSAACTTRFDLVTDLDQPYELPRLDTYYFRDNQILEEWGTSRFTAYVKLRKAGRTVKSAAGLASHRRR